MKTLGFMGLLLASAMAFASVPPTGKTTEDTAVYQNPSEITTRPTGRLSFDQDLKNLNDMEHRYHERLPRLADRPELLSPIKRIAAKKYKAAHPKKKIAQE